MERLKQIIRGHGGHASHLFDISVQVVIVVSLAAMAFRTMPDLPPRVATALLAIEIFSLAFFTIEYALRIYAAENRRQYLFSFWGIIDFLAIVPTLVLLGFDTRGLRALRLLRLFRIFRLGQASAFDLLVTAIRSVWNEFLVFLFLTLILFFIAATGIYAFEHEAQPEAFGSIPASMWWAVATLTTVGYGDVYPVTTGGAFSRHWSCWSGSALWRSRRA